MATFTKVLSGSWQVRVRRKCESAITNSTVAKPIYIAYDAARLHCIPTQRVGTRAVKQGMMQELLTGKTRLI